MALKKVAELKKIRVEFNPGAEVTYTYLCKESLFEKLHEGDYLLVPVTPMGRSQSVFKIVRVVGEDVAPLKPGINYKEVIGRVVIEED